MEAMQDARKSVDPGFSATKRRILDFVKRTGPSSLAELAAELGISKMATLKHMNGLEAKGVVERSFRAAGRGRPRVIFGLTTNATRLFPEAYANMTIAALDFIETRIGRAAVATLLEQRATEVYDRHRKEFDGKGLGERVQVLAQTRDEGGYMAEVGTTRRHSFELLEHNCPILAVAGRFGEACAIERDLFQKLLRADVDVTHRVVAGAPVCRFMIRRRQNERSP